MPYRLLLARMPYGTILRKKEHVADSGAGNYDGSIERYATAQLSLSYMASAEWTGTLTYMDQTLFGSPINTSLGQGIAIQAQRRWGK